MKRTPLPPRKAYITRRVRVRKKKRSAADFRRVYGSKERVTWMKDRRCCACFAPPPSEIAHVETGGMGRKADASKTIPLCHRCHADLHRMGVQSFAAVHGMNLGELAFLYDHAWESVTPSAGDPAGAKP